VVFQGKGRIKRTRKISRKTILIPIIIVVLAAGAF